MSKTKRKLGKPNMIRFDDPTKADLEAVAAANNLSVSAIVRVAVEQQMSALKAGRIRMRPVS